MKKAKKNKGISMDVNKKFNKGFSLVIAVMIIIAIVLLILAAIPIYKYYSDEAKDSACDIELATARDMLTIDYISENADPSPADAKETVTYAMNGWDDLCPAGGDTYVIDNPDAEEPPYTVVCGLHDSDTKERTRLNASNVLDQLKELVSEQKLADKKATTELTITLNSTKYTCERVKKAKNFKRGTKTTKDYENEGTVIFYGLNGSGEWNDPEIKKGEIAYFCFADENHCAIWKSDDGWTGDSYQE